MHEQLENIINNQVLIIDGSMNGVSGTSINRDLYNKWKGLKSISSERFMRFLQEAQNTLDLVCSEKAFVIPEVALEVEEHLRIINGQYEYFSVPNRRSNDPDEEEQDNRVYLLKQCCDKLHQVAKKMNSISAKSKEITNSLSFGLFLQIASNNSTKMSTRDTERNMKNYRPSPMGIHLNTDCKILASAFCIAYENPVLILSRDNRLTLLAKTLGNYLHSDLCKGRYKIKCVPEKTIEVYNPNFTEEENPLIVYQPKPSIKKVEQKIELTR